MTVEVTTPYGDRYLVNCHTGRLVYLRRDGGRVEGSTQWRITGIARTGPGFAFGQPIPGGLQALADLVGRDDLRYKRSRAPKYTLMDLNRGTRRIHGNPKYHGIASVHVIKGRI